MIGEARRLAVDVPLPDGVTLRRVTSEADVRAMSAMADEGFGDPVSTERADAVLAPAGPRRRDGAVGGRGRRRMVGAGRLEPVAGTEFAGIWGGATLRAVARPRHLPGADRGAGAVARCGSASG